jgi:hypothetical protein
MERIMFDIEKFLDLTSYEVTRKDRRKGSKSTQEFFTPYSIVKRMCDKVSDEDWSDPKKTFLEPSCGNGQFVIYIVWNRLRHGIDWKTVLKTTYALDLMQDNVAEMKERVHKMLLQLCHDTYDKASATRIMNKNFICHNFFTWDFENWRPMTEEEIKISKRNK